MDLLTFITFAGAGISFVAGVISQLWKNSVEVEGTIRKRLTPAGWLSLGIALVGLLASVGSILVSVNIKKNAQLQVQAEAAQKAAFQEQESRWRSETSSMLKLAKDDIAQNLSNTIAGFQDSQERFNSTQAQIISSKQSVLESNLHHTNDIIVAGQPLTSLAVGWHFESRSPELWQRIKEGEVAIDENAREATGPSHPVPLETMDYREALIPLLSRVARIASEPAAKDESDAEEATEKDENEPAETVETVIVLIALDDSENAILSFGQIRNDVAWFNKEGEPSISAGFLSSQGFQVGNSIPSVLSSLAANRRGRSSYMVNWNLDPDTLAKSVNRRNAAIPPTAKLPQTLKVAIFYDVTMIPFALNNFATPYAVNLWRDNETTRHNIPLSRELRNSTFFLEVNGVRRPTYALKRMYRLDLINEYEDDIETGCTLLEFEAA